MMFCFRFLNAPATWLLASALIVGIYSGCAPSQKTTTSTQERVERNASTISSLRSWLSARSLLARNMSVDGDITVYQNGASNSASFSMKSKRLADPEESDDPGEIERIDSLSVEVFGPFGIKVARFLASPEKYQFYDILHDETMAGSTDTHSLEGLTQLRGVSLPAMNDIIYGIAGGDINSDDSLQFFSDGETHRLVIRNMNASVTELLKFEGQLPDDSSAGNLFLAEYLRWNGNIDPASSSKSPDVAVSFESPIVVNGVSVPQHITAVVGENKLTLDYNHIEVNSRSIIVRIKMP